MNDKYHNGLNPDACPGIKKPKLIYGTSDAQAWPRTGYPMHPRRYQRRLKKHEKLLRNIHRKFRYIFSKSVDDHLKKVVEAHEYVFGLTGISEKYFGGADPLPGLPVIHSKLTKDEVIEQFRNAYPLTYDEMFFPELSTPRIPVDSKDYSDKVNEHSRTIDETYKKDKP